ncbi:MAG: hypothetical protein J3K34DRAFT_395091 [Monoraphidium minutum]|nr:MAG: hypothetical protein J3K34DRAFT_395091 [Monoraphidium minutum]
MPGGGARRAAGGVAAGAQRSPEGRPPAARAGAWGGRGAEFDEAMGQLAALLDSDPEVLLWSLVHACQEGGAPPGRRGRRGRRAGAVRAELCAAAAAAVSALMAARARLAVVDAGGASSGGGAASPAGAEAAPPGSADGCSWPWPAPQPAASICQPPAPDAAAAPPQPPPRAASPFGVAAAQRVTADGSWPVQAAAAAAAPHAFGQGPSRLAPEPGGMWGGGRGGAAPHTHTPAGGATPHGWGPEAAAATGGRAGDGWLGRGWPGCEWAEPCWPAQPFC